MKEDLKQYMTNLLYYAHDNLNDARGQEFDKWVEEKINEIDEYFASQFREISEISDEVEDIIDCIIKYDDADSVGNKARFFDVIQRDLRKVMQTRDQLRKNKGISEGITKGISDEEITKVLLDFNSWMCGKQYDGKIPLIKTCIKEYLEHFKGNHVTMNDLKVADKE